MAYQETDNSGKHILGKPRANRVRGTGQSGDRPSEGGCGGHNVSRKHLSPLMVRVLLDVGDGIERGELLEKLYRLPRRYCGFDADLCLRGGERQDHERRYHRAQPVLTRSLSRLEKRGLVRLIRRGRYVKGVTLTEEGRCLVRELCAGEKEARPESKATRLRARICDG